MSLKKEKKKNTHPRVAMKKRNRQNDELDDRHAKRKRQAQSDESAHLLLKELPCAAMYERSFMHKSSLCLVAVSVRSQFVATASVDGVLKFWKKKPLGIEFVRQFDTGTASLISMGFSCDQTLLAVLARGGALLVFDVRTADMIRSIRLGFDGLAMAWLADDKLAASDRNSSRVYVFGVDVDVVLVDDDDDDQSETATEASNEADDDVESARRRYSVVDKHGESVALLRYNEARRSLISIDRRGFVDYWRADGSFPSDAVSFRYRSDTDLYEFAETRQPPLSLDVSHSGALWATMAKDGKLRIFDFASGKITLTLDESMSHYHGLQTASDPMFHLENFEFGKRIARERGIAERADELPPPNIVFDRSDRFIIFSTMHGAKIVDVRTGALRGLLGQVENTERFLSLALHQGVASDSIALSSSPSSSSSSSSSLSLLSQPDPTLFCIGFQSQRFFMFSRREPPDELDEHGIGRDVLNEMPVDGGAASASAAAAATTGLMMRAAAAAASTKAASLPSEAIVHTSLGDFKVSLFARRCPKTVENWTTLAKRGYYDQVTFHRVIADFMVQTGDPRGDGTGGESIWGEHFADEFDASLRHDEPYTMSMANAGPNTNGSQFFIATAPSCPHLDNVHTVFGRVHRGASAAVIDAIGSTPVDSKHRPLKPIKILSISFA
jgi:peptidylprolyl isomerase domain and WD repeat-containing protein 1